MSCSEQRTLIGDGSEIRCLMGRCRRSATSLFVGRKSGLFQVGFSGRCDPALGG